MEIWDLYDKDRNKLDIKVNRGDKIPEKCYYLAIHVCIFNFEGKMLVQKRTASKASFAGFWDLSAGGGAQSGDSSSAAIERELREELGLNISFAEIRPALTIHFDKGFDDIYLIQRDIDISELTLQEDEVDEVKWVSQNELLNMIDDGSFVPYHKSLIELCFAMCNNRDAINR